MGRTDAVQFTLEWAADARRLGGLVEFEPGWETRGNGTSANYEGGVVHHTAFLSSAGNPFPAKSTLKAGRSDLPGPLCNVAGPWCEDGAPRLVVIAAHPANHAGASGGKSMGPLPVTSLFNPRVFGLEIDYGGVVPMTKGQRKAATIFSRALVNVLRRSAEYVRAHAETSITGKWDPGEAPNRTIDMAAFRQGVANFTGSSEEFTVAQYDEIMRYLVSIDSRLSGDVSDGMDRVGEIWAEINDVKKLLVGSTPADGDRLFDIWKKLETIEKELADVRTALAAEG